MNRPTSVEITASNVEDAIEKGLEQLGVGPSQVIVEVIEEPSRGLFGLGAKQARVRLQLLAPPPPPKPAAPPPTAPSDEAPASPAEAEAPTADEPAEAIDDVEDADDEPEAVVEQPTEPTAPEPVTPPYDDDDDDFFNEDGTYREDVEEVKPPKPAKRAQKKDDDYRPPRKRERSSRRKERQDESQVSSVETPPIVFPTEGTDADLAHQLLTEMMEIMRINADLDVARAEPSERDNEDGPPWILNIAGDDKRMGDLIGKRGDTLSALQYLTRLMVSKQTEARANVIVDVDGYRRSRSEKLERLANRMADQAIETGRMVKMEPMPPHERRIIHMVLRKRDDVETESQGQGNARRVTIMPK